jgi:hypothetical protein
VNELLEEVMGKTLRIDTGTGVESYPGTLEQVEEDYISCSGTSLAKIGGI